MENGEGWCKIEEQFWAGSEDLRPDDTHMFKGEKKCKLRVWYHYLSCQLNARKPGIAHYACRHHLLPMSIA